MVIFLVIFTLLRLATYFAFKPKGYSFGEMIPSFLMGIRYDLRWIAIILLPVVVFSMIPKLSPFSSSRNKKVDLVSRYCDIYCFFLFCRGLWQFFL